MGQIRSDTLMPERRKNMDDFITRHEHENFAELMRSENQRLKDENDRQNHRLADLEVTTQEIHALALSVKELTASVQSMVAEQAKINRSVEKQGERIGSLENRDGEKWRQITGYVLTTIVGIILGFIAMYIGL